MAHLLGHMQVMSLQWIAFYMLTLLMAMRALLAGRAWLHYTLMSALFLVFTGLCDWYFVLYLIFFTAIALLWMGTTILIRGRQSADSEPGSKRGWVDPLINLIWLSVPALLAGLLFFVTLSFWLVPMVHQARQFDFMVRPQSDLYILSASLMDFLVPNRLHTLFRPASFSWIGNQVAPISERTLAVGYIPLVLAIIGVFMRTRRALFWAVIALLFLMLALGPIIHLGNITWDDIPTQSDVQFHMTPMGVLNYLLPMARISRSISRFALMAAVESGSAGWAGHSSAPCSPAQRTHGRCCERAAAGAGSCRVLGGTLSAESSRHARLLQ